MKYPIADQEKFAFLKDKTILFDMQKTFYSNNLKRFL